MVTYRDLKVGDKITTSDLPTQQNLWSASVGFMLAMLVQLKMLISKDGSIIPPKIGMLI